MTDIQYPEMWARHGIQGELADGHLFDNISAQKHLGILENRHIIDFVSKNGV